MNHAIKLLKNGKGDRSHPRAIEIYLVLNQHNIIEPEIKIIGYEQHEFKYELRNRDQWDVLGKAIGRSPTIRTLTLLQRVGDGDEELIVSDEEYQCLQLFYRGIQSNSSIEDLVFFSFSSNDEILPTFNLIDAQFKEKLKSIKLIGDAPITNNQSVMISSVLENTSLKSLSVKSELPPSESASRRLILACANVEELTVECSNTSQFNAVAELLRNPTSILGELILLDTVMAYAAYHNNLSTVVAGLAGNVTLKRLSFPPASASVVNLIRKLLCDNTSIENIYNSNHTLEEFSPLNLRGFPEAHILKDLLELNTNTNEEEIIHRKIARYYFVGDFALSPFFNMKTSALPKVLAMIEGSANSRRSAIFRLLRSIPDLCNVTSREVIAEVTSRNNKSFNKHQLYNCFSKCLSRRRR
eukprot:scaffold226867_cov36-Cyclotella_meneghiniana.AAC.1